MPNVRVQCQALGCKACYVTGRKGLYEQQNRCPVCNSYKARQLPVTDSKYKDTD